MGDIYTQILHELMEHAVTICNSWSTKEGSHLHARHQYNRNSMRRMDFFILSILQRVGRQVVKVFMYTSLPKSYQLMAPVLV